MIPDKLKAKYILDRPEVVLSCFENILELEESKEVADAHRLITKKHKDLIEGSESNKTS